MSGFVEAALAMSAIGRAPVPDALQRPSRCCAEPGPLRTPNLVRPRLCSAPRREERRAALRPGNGPSRFKKTIRRILRRTLLRHRFVEPLDLTIEQRDAFGELLHREQIEVLPDLVGDLLARLVVVVCGHRSCSGGSVKANQDLSVI